MDKHDNETMMPLESNSFTLGIQAEDVKDVFAAVDNATADELDRLQREEQVTPTCTRGCDHCCSYHIVLSDAEVFTLAQYIRRAFTDEAIQAVWQRTYDWQAWYGSRLRKGEKGLCNNVFPCPLLYEGECSVYPVRPVVCRTHFVSSPARVCAKMYDSVPATDRPIVLRSVIDASADVVDAFEMHIQRTGQDYSRSQQLLPHGLAMAMGWDFL